MSNRLQLTCQNCFSSPKPAFGVPGRREWPAFVDWFSENLQPSLEGWIGPVQVVYEGAKPLPADGRYVFGYQPHGLFPIGERPFVRMYMCLARATKTVPACKGHLRGCWVAACQPPFCDLATSGLACSPLVRLVNQF